MRRRKRTGIKQRILEARLAKTTGQPAAKETDVQDFVTQRGRGSDAAPADRPARCRTCDGADLTTLTAQEMMFGTRDRFRYQECAGCGCVQIAAYPDDMARYYPADYYSLRAGAPVAGQAGWAGRVANWARWQALRRIPPLRRWYFARTGVAAFVARRPLLAAYRTHVPDPGARILDVGCGTGALLRDLRAVHYRRAEGVDPFIASPVTHGGRPLVRKASFSDMDGEYDCISFHHVLEHMPDQAGTLRHARRLLAPGGLVLVRIPAAGGAAWRRYREDWVQLDAPRHFYLHTERSLALVAGQAGLKVAEISYDSNGFQFWGSELYRRGIPLQDPRSPATPGDSIFPAEQLAAWEDEARALNEARDGDQFLAVLRPA